MGQRHCGQSCRPLARAITGDVIEVAEGTYREAISLAAVDVDIIGVGERANIIVESASKPVLTFRALKGLVRNLTLRQTGGGCDCAVCVCVCVCARARVSIYT